MIHPLTILWLWSFITISSASPMRNIFQQIDGRINGTVEGIGDYFSPETNVIEHGAIPYFMEPLSADRPKRDVEMEDLENVSFEVPTIMHVNDSKNGEFQVSLVGPDINSHATSYSGCQKPFQPQSRPITLTISVDNIIPPGKAEKFIVTNTSEIQGCGAVFRINLYETKTTACSNSDVVFNFDALTTPSSVLSDRIEVQKNKKKNDEEEEEEQNEKKTIQEILKKILSSSGVNKGSIQSDDLPSLIKNTSGEPLTLILNPSLVQKFTSKFDSTTAHKPVTFNYKSPNPPEYDNVCKLVEELSSNLPKAKLVSLLSSLISKVSPGKSDA